MKSDKEGKILLITLEWGGVELDPFVSRHVENEWGGIEPTLFVSKHVDNQWGGVEPTPFASRQVENERVESNPTHWRPNVLKTSGVGLDPPCSCRNT